MKKLQYRIFEKLQYKILERVLSQISLFEVLDYYAHHCWYNEFEFTLNDFLRYAKNLKKQNKIH